MTVPHGFEFIGACEAFACRQINEMKGTNMKLVIRYRSQPRIIVRGNYKPHRVLQIRPAQKAALIVGPARAGPQINTYEYTTD